MSRIDTGLVFDWPRIGTEMELDWRWIDWDGRQIGTGSGVDWHWIDRDRSRFGIGLDWWIGNGLTQIADRLALNWVDFDWHRIDDGFVFGSAMDWEKWNELENLSRIGGLVANRHWKVRLVDWSRIGIGLVMDWQRLCLLIMHWLDLCCIGGGLT